METYNGYRPRLVIMLKAPRMGKCKTRLSKDIGAASAISFYRHSVAKLIAELGTDKRWETVLAVDPVSSLYAGWENIWPLHLPRVTQGIGDLGARMGLLFQHLASGPVIVIGSDAPSISKQMIADAFQHLKGTDAVFGPAEDGGYWLVGMKRLRTARHLFQDVRWSSADTLDDTLASLPVFPFTYRLLDEMPDVDQGEDLKAQAFALLRSSKAYPS